MSASSQHLEKYVMQCCCQFAHFSWVITEIVSSPVVCRRCRRHWHMDMPASLALWESENCCCISGVDRKFLIPHFQALNASSMGVSIGEYGGRKRIWWWWGWLRRTLRWHGALSKMKTQSTSLPIFSPSSSKKDCKTAEFVPPTTNLCSSTPRWGEIARMMLIFSPRCPWTVRTAHSPTGARPLVRWVHTLNPISSM